jgi:hypothetical protein
MYILSRFGSTLLPNRVPSSDAGTGDSLDSIAPLPDGNKFDYWGSDQTPRADVPITHIGKIVGTSTADATAQFRALRALRGKRAKLYRTLQTEDGEAVEWCWARCLSAPATHERQNIRHQVVELQFKMLSPIWYGRRRGGWSFDDGESFDDGLFFDEGALVFDTTEDPFSIYNDGNATVKNAVITLTATGAVTNPIILNTANGIGMKYNGGLVNTDVLVFDCGAKSLKKNGTEVYQDFEAIATDSASAWWFPIEPGENEIELTGTNYEVEFRYSDGWE